MPRAINGIDRRVFGVHLVTDASINDHRDAVAADQQRTHRERDPILLVGRSALLPERLRHDAEHGAAVQAEEAIEERGQFEITDPNQCYSPSRGTSPRLTSKNR